MSQGLPSSQTSWAPGCMDKTQPCRVRWGEWLQGPPILSRDAPSEHASLWLSRLHRRVDLAVQHDFQLLTCYLKACADATPAAEGGSGNGHRGGSPGPDQPAKFTDPTAQTLQALQL